MPLTETERALLEKELQLKEETIRTSLSEGQLLMEDIEKLKKSLSNYGIVPEVFHGPEKVSKTQVWNQET